MPNRLLKIAEHLGRSAESPADVVLASLGHVVKDRDAFPFLANHIEFADDQRHQIGGMRLVLFPMEGHGLVAGIVLALDQFAVGKQPRSLPAR